MAGKTNLNEIVKAMAPVLNKGKYVFSSVFDTEGIHENDILCTFKEAEGTTLILSKEKADELELKYDYVASWITLQVHSSLDTLGLTALFSGELAKHKISCNVIAGYHHDHIFVDTKDASAAINALKRLSERYSGS